MEIETLSTQFKNFVKNNPFPSNLKFTICKNDTSEEFNPLYSDSTLSIVGFLLAFTNSHTLIITYNDYKKKKFEIKTKFEMHGDNNGYIKKDDNIINHMMEQFTISYAKLILLKSTPMLTIFKSEMYDNGDKLKCQCAYSTLNDIKSTFFIIQYEHWKMLSKEPQIQHMEIAQIGSVFVRGSGPNVCVEWLKNLLNEEDDDAYYSNSEPLTESVFKKMEKAEKIRPFNLCIYVKCGTIFGDLLKSYSVYQLQYNYIDEDGDKATMVKIEKITTDKIEQIVSTKGVNSWHKERIKTRELNIV